MAEQPLKNLHLFVTGIVAISIWSLLIWTHYHGGVPSHHILNREDLPAVSNWWGALLLPALAFICSYRIQRRVRQDAVGEYKLESTKRNILFGFLGAMAFGVALAVCFTMDYTTVSDYLVDGLLVLLFIVPIFRSEYILGFTLGMTVTFGAILPTAFALVVASLSALIYNFVRPLLLWLYKWVYEKIARPAAK